MNCQFTVALTELCLQAHHHRTLLHTSCITASMLATAQRVYGCLQVWNAQDAQDEVLVMVVRCLPNVAFTSSAYGTNKRDQLRFA